MSTATSVPGSVQVAAAYYRGMRILVVGAGVIGLSYGWLLNRGHEVSVLARPQRAEALRAGVAVRLRDLAHGGAVCGSRFTPEVVTEPVEADLVLVTVDRTHLGEVLGLLTPLAGRIPILLMLNHWDITAEAGEYLDRADYLLGFPGQVGGGHVSGGVEAALFARGTVLERGDQGSSELLDTIERALTGAGLSVRRERDLPGWLAVHYLQQSVTLGPLLEAGGYDELVGDGRALRRMVLALREGVAVCRARGIAADRIAPVPLLRLPAGLVARGLRRILASAETRRMVLAHMGHGRGEWEAGLLEVADTGRSLGVDMPVWDSYAARLRTR